jgi:hypothetical protein
MTVIHKPAIVIQELGELGRLPDGGVINAGGVAGPHFTIDGKAVILADGTASDGSGPVLSLGGTVIGYEHVQATPATTWVVVHNKNTEKLQPTIWDSVNELLYADVVKIIDPNTVFIHFSTPQQGRAILLLF